MTSGTALNCPRSQWKRTRNLKSRMLVIRKLSKLEAVSMMDTLYGNMICPAPPRPGLGWCTTLV